MPIYRRGDIVRVPFPYTDRDTQQRRPALVVCHQPLGDEARLLWVAMITSASNRRWIDDVEIDDDPATTGLSAASLVRVAKLSTIEVALAAPLGRLNAAQCDQVSERIKSYL